MKLRIYIIKKQQLIWTAIILAIVIIAAILLISLKTKDTMNVINKTKSQKVDINNDGKMDTIITKIDEKTKEYSVDIIMKDGRSYSLVPDDKEIPTFGFYSDEWPMIVEARDINSDNKPEIILQSSDSNGPLLHVYKYENDKISRIFSGRYSIFGNIKNPVDNSDIIILGSKEKDSIKYTYYNSRFNLITPASSLTLGREALASFIDFVEAKDQTAFKSNVDDKYLSKVLKGTFLDSKLREVKYTKYTIPSQCTYFVRTNISNGNEKDIGMYLVTMNLTKFDNKSPEYTITNISRTK
ncbi:hypothetical protein [Fonticella tunisiensis]|uniref:Uncharacterized protein n=1 Tax=Fonticella tunisiensis TaxID=1096341 RepID=A0A4R7KQ33_9CLOT|nr:hypothetical protein [Fonticella tunisiensis]TDT61145.1 hypothetical protein EDD71_10842 [Fonticella tunisiensis]